MTNHPEQKIQHKIINWCRDRGLKVYGTANGQFLNSWSGLRERATLGKGLPDLFILIPADRSHTAITTMIAMEVKSEKGRATKEQAEFLALVNSIKGQIYGLVVHNLDEAMAFLKPLLCEKPELTNDEIEAIVHNL